MSKSLQALIMAIAFLLLFGFILHKAVQRQERIECEQWAKDAKQYTKFYYTDWQKKQCKIYD